MEATIAVTTSRLRPNRMAASLPATLAKVPIRPSPVATMAGDRPKRPLHPWQRRRSQGTPRPSRARRSFQECGRNRQSHKPLPSGCGTPDENHTGLPVLGWLPRLVCAGHDERDEHPGNCRAYGCRDESRLPAGSGSDEVTCCKRKSARNADARRVSRRGARHHFGVNAIGQKLQARHIGARPAHAGEGTQQQRRPEAFRKQTKQQMAQRRWLLRQRGTRAWDQRDRSR